MPVRFYFLFKEMWYTFCNTVHLQFSCHTCVTRTSMTSISSAASRTVKRRTFGSWRTKTPLFQCDHCSLTRTAVQLWDRLWWTLCPIWNVWSICNNMCDDHLQHLKSLDNSCCHFHWNSCSSRLFQPVTFSKWHGSQVHSFSCTRWLTDMAWLNKWNAKAHSYR